MEKGEDGEGGRVGGRERDEKNKQKNGETEER